MPNSKGRCWIPLTAFLYITYLIYSQTLMNILPYTANARWPGVKPGRTIQGMSTAMGEGVMALDCRWFSAFCQLRDFKHEYLDPFFSSNRHWIRSIFYMGSPCHHGETAEEELFDLLTCHRSDSWPFHLRFNVVFFGLMITLFKYITQYHDFCCHHKINDSRKRMVHSHGIVCHPPVCQLPVAESLKIIKGNWLIPAKTKT